MVLKPFSVIVVNLGLIANPGIRYLIFISMIHVVLVNFKTIYNFYDLFESIIKWILYV